MKTGNLIYFFSVFLQTGSLSVNIIAGRTSDKKKAELVIYSIISRGLLCLLSSPVHFFPAVLFLPINFCLISRETGQKVIITGDPGEVKNVIIKLGRAQPSASMLFSILYCVRKGMVVVFIIILDLGEPFLQISCIKL